MNEGFARNDAFDQHVVPHVPMLLHLALSLTGQPADAEDLVQDTLIGAYRGVDRFDGAHVRAWLRTIMRNTHINRNRRRRPVLLRNALPRGTVMSRLHRARAKIRACLDDTDTVSYPRRL